MRAIFALLILIAAGLTGCESDVPPAPNSSSGVNTFERGISGKGTLTQPDKSDDPVINENTRPGN